MTSFDFSRYALRIGAAVALLAGCGGSQSPSSAPGAMPQSAHPATSSYAVLYRFKGKANGDEPSGRLLDFDRTLYGTATEGGAGDCPHGCGTVYSMSPRGGVILLFSFSGGNGRRPAGLIEIKRTLYGTTDQGGARDRGTVYRITTAGVERVLHSFTGHCRTGPCDGQNPTGPLINVKGTLYGTTFYGGGIKCGGKGCGVVYSITASGAETVLYRFKGDSDGAAPNALIFLHGTLYGTTAKGGAGYNGTFYSLSLSGKHKVLYNFGGVSGDGLDPEGELIQLNGTVYGTTPAGGSGLGTVYGITTSGAEQVVYRFAGGSDGVEPLGGLLNLNGTLYGTTLGGGNFASGCIEGCGTIYSLTTSGAENVLHRFGAGGDGFNPTAPLTEVGGSLYGTTFYGGAPSKHSKTCCGTIFRFTP